MKSIWGEAYGAPIMSGVVNGVQEKLDEIFPTGLRVHLSSHSLNFEICGNSDIREIWHCMSLLSEPNLFFNVTKK